MDKMRMETPDLTVANVEKIGMLFPNCITETADENGKQKKAINFDLLRQMLSEDVVEGDEAYEFTWVGKKAAIVEANKPIRKTLRPCPEESVDWDTTENLYIEGDNLEVLKLLQESYLGQIKMIYIDPPYNTGNDFVYADDFRVSSEEWNEESGTIDSNGFRMIRNTDNNGRFHSDWCSMMYSRLLIARNLLTDDGVIFVSIDDNESANLKKMLDEIFGECGFVACFKWNRTAKAPSLSDSVRTKYEYIFCYEKGNSGKFYGKPSYNTEAPLLNMPNRIAVIEFPPKSFQIPASFAPKRYSEKYGVELLTPVTRSDDGFNTEGFSLQARFKWGQEKINQYLAKGKVFKIKKDFSTIYYAMDPEESFIPPADVINDEECNVKRNTEAADYLRKIGIPFDYSKPVSLLHYLVKMVTYKDKEAIVMDFFSGSSTTAHAVMQVNADDGGRRKFIMVQLAESCDENDDAYKAGFKTICDIGKERIRRSSEEIRTETPLSSYTLDTGFRVFRLDESNMNDVYYAAGDYTQDMLTMLESNVKSDRTDLDLLFGCLLEWGLPLSMPYKSETIDDCTVHTYNDGDLIACFDENIPDVVIKEIARRQPLRAVFRDSSFNGSPAKINVGEIFKMLAPDTRVKVI